MSNVLLHLEALLESINKIKEYSSEFDDAEDFYHDCKSFDATMMQFVVIGESISRIDDDFKYNQNQIPSCPPPNTTHKKKALPLNKER